MSVQAIAPLLAQCHLLPGALERYRYVAVGQEDLYVVLLGGVDGLEHLRPGLGAEFLP